MSDPSGFHTSAQGNQVIEVVTPATSISVVEQGGGTLTVVQNIPHPTELTVAPITLEIGVPGPQGRPGRDGDGTGAGATPGNHKLTYDAQGRVARVDTYYDSARTDLLKSQTLSYDAQGLVAQVKHYDSAGALVRTVDLVWVGSTLTGTQETPA